MIYNTRYLLENFEQCRLEKTIFHVRSSWNAQIQNSGKTMKRLILYFQLNLTVYQKPLLDENAAQS